MPDPSEKGKPLLLSRQKVCSLLSISIRDYYQLIQAGKLHPILTSNKHTRVPLAEVMAIKSEMAHRAIALPYEKFVQAATFFCPSAMEINHFLTKHDYPRAPVEYVQRMRLQIESDPSAPIIKAKTADEFFAVFGRALEILKRPDLRLLVECLHMIGKGEKEIQETVRGKYGREYGLDDILRFIEYFWNWRIMDPESVQFYFGFLQGRDLLLKQCAYRRADYFIYYALGIDFGGEISTLLERSCLGLLHKLNMFVDGYVYGEFGATQKDIQHLADIISTLLGAAESVRSGKVPKKGQEDLAKNLLPSAMTRDDFFKTEKALDFKPKG